jgi:hypothetical protein
MKAATTPFNPIVIPDLNLPATPPASASPKVKVSRGKTAARRPRRPAITRRALDPKASTLRLARKFTRKAKDSWQRIKGGLHARLARLDPEKLKRVLVACGIAATLALLIIALSKLTPLLVALLAVLGLSVLLRLWDRLRVVGVPF